MFRGEVYGWQRPLTASNGEGRGWTGALLEGGQRPGHCWVCYLAHRGSRQPGRLALYPGAFGIVNAIVVPRPGSLDA